MKRKRNRAKAGADFYATRPHPDLLYAGVSRHFSAHHLLLETARLAANSEAIDTADQNRIAVTAITISAFALEAFANAAGEELLPRWSDFANLTPWGKLRLVGEHLGLHPDPGSQPWQDVAWLTKVRNSIAHAKPESILFEQWLPAETIRARLNGHETPVPLSALEEQLTRANALRAVKAIEAVKSLVEAALPRDRHFRFRADVLAAAYEPPPDDIAGS